MATNPYTQADINDLWTQTYGKTAKTAQDAQTIRDQATEIARQRGISAEEIGGMLDTAQTTYTTKNTPWNNGLAANADQLKVAQDWAKGKSSDELAAKGQEMNLTADQFGSVFGRTGAEATNVGYGTSTGLISSARGLTWDGTNWVKPAEAPAPTSTPAPAPAPAPTPTPTPTPTATAAPVPTPAPVAEVEPEAVPVPIGSNGEPIVAQGYTAERVATTPDMTIEGRMRGLMDPNDPRNQQLATQAKQIANGRGVMNSSMGDSMIQDGIIKNAIAIAQPDAAMTAENARFSANAGNQAGSFNAGEQNKFGLNTQDAAYALQRQALAQDYLKSNMATTQGYDLEKMAKNYGYDLGKMSQQQINDMVKLATVQGYTQANMELGSKLNIEQMSAAQKFELNKMAVNQGYTLTNMTTAQSNDLQKMSAANDFLKSNMGLQNTFDISKMEKAAALTLAQMDHQQLQTVATLAIKQGYDVANLTSAQATQLAAAGISASAATTAAAMAADARRELQMDQNAFTTLTNGSQNALSIVSGLQNKFQQIQMDTNITDPAAKKAALTDATNIARAAMGVIAHSTNDASFNAVLDMIDL